MSQNYTPEFKKKIVRLHEEEGRTSKNDRQRLQLDGQPAQCLNVV